MNRTAPPAKPARRRQGAVVIRVPEALEGELDARHQFRPEGQAGGGGDAPERSLLVPGDGAPAPYDIADREALVEAILAYVPADKVQFVASLDTA